MRVRDFGAIPTASESFYNPGMMGSTTTDKAALSKATPGLWANLRATQVEIENAPNEPELAPVKAESAQLEQKLRQLVVEYQENFNWDSVFGRSPAKEKLVLNAKAALENSLAAEEGLRTRLNQAQERLNARKAAEQEKARLTAQAEQEKAAALRAAASTVKMQAQTSQIQAQKQVESAAFDYENFSRQMKKAQEKADSVTILGMPWWAVALGGVAVLGVGGYVIFSK